MFHLEGLGFVFPPQVAAQAKLGATSSQGHGLRIGAWIAVAIAINLFRAGGLAGNAPVFPVDCEGAGEGEAIANLLGVNDQAFPTSKAT
ncbi:MULTISPECIES: hypothetical protein [unclassified Synechocystis]|uniref:hypothetical protein n=1 Tax=unclassified Synechocystis TaxID=2640012 RepID=UPI0013053202|nr:MULTISPECIES: hypothetical protein [unclassified Synechocystis]MBD2619897.1 hypothetical protein [Synechocystis sp. FACHB-898]MBD2640812.1 hypothetical protein [Synechocystis sp. FACHB-908]MBD2662696.1 hypothetical protein [Synechocystis sp. FACHB-929]NHM00271.1 hypothetical protein [Synechocystis sp. PCC 6803]QWO82283.1 hypothetical protein KBZ93_16915 [Synechocystis sp. PCC 6803]